MQMRISKPKLEEQLQEGQGQFDYERMSITWTPSRRSGDLHEMEDFILAGSPTFDAAEHPVVCAELKSLYVAVTPARNKLVLIERCSENDILPFINVLRQDLKDPIVDLVKPSDPKYNEKLLEL
ncbi:MAG: hypothetical protein Q9184_001745 [Pyrenodesmia sp. 2 TL-2023]